MDHLYAGFELYLTLRKNVRDVKMDCVPVSQRQGIENLDRLFLCEFLEERYWINGLMKQDGIALKLSGSATTVCRKLLLITHYPAINLFVRFKPLMNVSDLWNKLVLVNANSTCSYNSVP